ncbi:hypothetical protein JDM601_1584 [Mycolicibacter sinensis]|uniref:Uncharacterized protein n=1 Tax=Mycolicibacter sinensis (strain JDM601) TaxID=875328 RepID=F5YZY0_MYCSD|nr:hypothetical protein JDM601_1584 [Mycolicibacter sinensis]
MFQPGRFVEYAHCDINPTRAQACCGPCGSRAGLAVFGGRTSWRIDWRWSLRSPPS